MRKASSQPLVGIFIIYFFHFFLQKFVFLVAFSYLCPRIEFQLFPKLIEITKRYARLANGNVGNFQRCARTVITVRAYSVDWLLHLHIKVILRPPLEDVVSAPRFLILLTVLWVAGGHKYIAV